MVEIKVVHEEETFITEGLNVTYKRLRYMTDEALEALSDILFKVDSYCPGLSPDHEVFCEREHIGVRDDEQNTVLGELIVLFYQKEQGGEWYNIVTKNCTIYISSNGRTIDVVKSGINS